MAQFEGFEIPTKNYFHMPNDWTDITAEIDNLAELKIVEYMVRHTWGYKEYGISKLISVDEFMNGRRRKDGSRMDKGTKLSEQSVRNGLKKAIKDGYITEEIDTSDAGRIKKYYALKMQVQVQDLDPPQDLDPLNVIPQGTNSYTSGPQTLDPRVLNVIPRSEKETIERQPKKETIEKQEEDNKVTYLSERKPSGDLPPMAMTSQQIKKQNEKREAEIWAIVERERGTKYNRNHRNLYAHREGMKKLVEDDIDDTTLIQALQSLDTYQQKSFTLLKFYEWLPNLTAKEKPNLKAVNTPKASNGNKPSTDIYTQASLDPERRQRNIDRLKAKAKAKADEQAEQERQLKAAQ